MEPSKPPALMSSISPRLDKLNMEELFGLDLALKLFVTVPSLHVWTLKATGEKCPVVFKGLNITHFIIIEYKFTARPRSANVDQMR